MTIFKLNIICPVCKAEKLLSFPKSIIKQTNDLSTSFIVKGLVYEHQFQVLIDKDYTIRSYQLVDYEFEKTNKKD